VTCWFVARSTLACVPMRAVKGRVYLSVSGFGGIKQVLNLALAIWSNAMRKAFSGIVAK